MFCQKMLFSTIALLALLSHIVRSDVVIEPGFVPHQETYSQTDNVLYVVGDLNGYHIEAFITDTGASTANMTCGHSVKNSESLGTYATGQCQTSSENATQTIQVTCINHYHPEKLAKGKGSAIVRFTDEFHYIPTERSQILVTAKNEIWFGFENAYLNENPTRLEKKPYGNFIGNKPKVIFNCHSDKISPIHM